MAFILSISPGRAAAAAGTGAPSPEAALLRLCSEGRELQEFALPGVRLAVDPVEHDCRLLRRRTPAGQELVAVCFGWCGLLDGDGARFDDRALDAVLAALRADPGHPARAVSRLTGNFVLVLLDPETARVFVWSDEWAVRCFYYGANGREVVVASRAAAAAALLREPLDGMAWIAGLRKTWPTAHGTMFHGVGRAMPGQTIVADLARGAVTLTRSDRFFERHVPRSFAESAEALCGAVRRSVFRCATLGPAFVDLTGGHDSRMTAGALHAAGRAPATVFQVGENAGDADGPLAKEIAARLGAKILCRDRDEEQDVPTDFFAACSVRADGYSMSLRNARRMWADRHSYGDFKYHMGAVGGGLARDTAWRHEYLRWWSFRTVDLPYFLQRRMHAKWQGRIVAAAGIDVAASRHDDYLLGPLRALARHLEGTAKCYALDLLHLSRMSQHMALDWAVAPTQTILSPFMSKEFLDVCLSIGWWQRAGRWLQLEVLSRLDDSLCDVPNDYGMTMLPLRWSTSIPHLRSLLSDALRRGILQTPKPLSGPRRSVPADLLARGGALESSGALPPEAARLWRWLLQEGTDAERLNLIPALVGLGELLTAYPGIRRELCFDGQEYPFLADVDLWPARPAAGRRETP